MIMALCLHGFEIGFLHAHMYVCGISNFVHDAYIIIFNQVAEAEMTVYMALLHLSRHVHQFPAIEIFFHFSYLE